MRRRLVLAVLAAIGFALPVRAQPRLTLPDAIARARAGNVDAREAAAAAREAAARLAETRGTYLPRVDLAESWQRGNQPVFVFGSLLSQRRFTTDNFAIATLNAPDPLDNFRTALTVEQAVFDPAAAPARRAARLGQQIADAERAGTAQDLAVEVTAAYGRVLVATAASEAARAALAAAHADRARAAARRDAGRATDADVLQLDVHLARVQEAGIRAEADARIARATLNILISEPVDAVFTFDPPVAVPAEIARDVAALEATALASRPDVLIARLREKQAASMRDRARAAFLPTVSAQAAWDVNGGRWTSRETSWIAGAAARLNLFNGGADRARLAAATAQVERTRLERERAENTVRLDLRIALARLEEARAREAASRAAVDQARESRRIVLDRYETGLADVASLLRAAETAQDAVTRHVAAQVDVLVAAAMLDRATGR